MYADIPLDQLQQNRIRMADEILLIGQMIFVKPQCKQNKSFDYLHSGEFSQCNYTTVLVYKQERKMFRFSKCLPAAVSVMILASGGAYSSVPDGNAIMLQWHSEAISWTLCFNQPVDLRVLGDDPKITVFPRESAGNNFHYTIAASGSTGNETLYLNSPAAIVPGCGGVKSGEQYYPASGQNQVEVSVRKEVSSKLSDIEDIEYSAVFMPKVSESSEVKPASTVVALQPFNKDKVFWSRLGVAPPYHKRTLMQSGGGEDGGSSFIHSKTITPLILTVAIGGTVLFCGVPTAIAACVIGYQCHKKFHKPKTTL